MDTNNTSDMAWAHEAVRELLDRLIKQAQAALRKQR